MVATILLACGVFTLLRTGGMTGDGDSDFHWRWTQTPEERLLAQADDEPAAPPSAPTAAKTVAFWPGFRGPDRDGIVRGVRIATDWSGSPPDKLWRRPVGPGWSSFAVGGNLLYTQEQRGEDDGSIFNVTQKRSSPSVLRRLSSGIVRRRPRRAPHFPPSRRLHHRRNVTRSEVLPVKSPSPP
jgi:hypothetical protein